MNGRLARRPLATKIGRPGNRDVTFDAKFALPRKIGAIRTAFESRFQCHQLTYSRAVAVGRIQSATCIECGNAAAWRFDSSVR
jgi:hypothetical protein